MSQAASPEPQAWQPFTPRGVARFAAASPNRLLVVQLVTTLFIACCVVWLLANCYSPVVLAAIQQLPRDAKISQQQLHGLRPGRLAENRFLSITVETAETPSIGVGDVQARFGPAQLKICSLFGCMEITYPAGWMISLSRSTVEPRWGAWKPMLLIGTGILVVVKLFVAWWLLGLIYMWAAKLIAFYADREMSASGNWKFACAAQLPGAWFAGMAIVLYGIGALDIVSFLVVYALHLPISWFYLVVSAFFLPKLGGKKGKKNPFKNARS